MNQERKVGVRSGLVPALLLAAAFSMLALTACGGSSGSSSTGSSGGAGSTAKLSGTPVKVMAVTPITSPSGSSIVAPEVGKVAEATSEFINANGGIGGRPLEVIVCDEKDEPTQDTACARKAVEEGVIADIGTYSIYGEKAYPVLEPAEISNVGPIAVNPSDSTSRIAFPLEAGPAVMAGLGQSAAQQPECKKIGIVQFQGPTTTLVETAIAGALEVEGKKLAYNIAIPPTATDYSGYANEVAQNGDCVILFVTGQTAEAIVPALRQVTEQPIIGFMQGFTPETVKKLGSEAEGTIVPQYFPLYSSDQLAEYREVLEKYSDTSSYDPTSYLSMNTYLSMRVFAAVASEVKDLTAPSFLKAISNANAVDGFGLAPTLNLTKANEWSGVAFAPRIFNRNMIYAKVEGEELVPLGSEKFQDLTQFGVEAYAHVEF